MLETEKLKNGLTILRVPMDGVESVATVVMVNAGSRYEKPESYGVAHFLEHMVFKGTEKYPNNQIISQTIDGIGAQFNAFTSQEMTEFFIRSAAKDIDLCLEMLGQMTTRMLIETKEINKERGVILEELHMYEDMPDAHNANEFDKMMFAGSGLGHDIGGTKETVSAMKRKHFLDFIDTWYRPENMLVVLAGKREAVMKKELSKKVEQFFQFRDFTGEKQQQRDWWEKRFVYGKRLNFIERKTEQTHFVLGWPGLDMFSKKDLQLGLLQVVMGGNMSSRLFSEVREKRGLCYYVRAMSDSFCDSGVLGAASGVNPDKLEEAVKVTVEEFGKVAEGKQALDKKELERAKNFLTGQLTLSQESVYGLALQYGTQYLFKQKVRTVAQTLREIEQITVEQVRALAADIIKSQELRLSAIGVIDDKQKSAIEKIVMG